jgi:hypothetical protein
VKRATPEEKICNESLQKQIDDGSVRIRGFVMQWAASHDAMRREFPAHFVLLARCFQRCVPDVAMFVAHVDARATTFVSQPYANA